MKRSLPLIALLLLCAAALYLAQHRKRADVVNPNAVVDAAADWQRDLTRAPMHLTRISDEQETNIGDALAAQYTAIQPPQDRESHATEQYIGQIGNLVAAHAKRRLPYRFHLIANRDLINAFALPGGHVFVGQGLLDRMTSEDELAFVLGHEIEHIDHFHAAERVQVEAQINNLDLGIIGSIAQIPMSLWQAGYSKDEEFEADREGLRIAAMAGYSAQGALNLLQRWAKLRDEYVVHSETPVDELSQVAIEGLGSYFRTHPLPSERLAQAQSLIADDHLPVDKPLKPFHVEYEITADDR
jgi:beta-barrel assembly-enhancing protease